MEFVTLLKRERSSESTNLDIFIELQKKFRETIKKVVKFFTFYK
jgi:hypothetical protein